MPRYIVHWSEKTLWNRIMPISITISFYRLKKLYVRYKISSFIKKFLWFYSSSQNKQMKSIFDFFLSDEYNNAQVVAATKSGKLWEMCHNWSNDKYNCTKITILSKITMLSWNQIHIRNLWSMMSIVSV